jgi:MFS family permease
MPAAGTARIMDQYQIAPERMGWIYSAFLITYTACMIPGGWIIDRFGAVVGLAIVLAGSAPFVALTGAVGLLANEAGALFVALIVVRALTGIVSAPLHPSCARVVANWVHGGGRSRANGLVNASALAGIAAAPPIFGLMIARFDWPVSFLIAGTVTAAVAVVWLVVARERPGLPEPISDGREPGDSGNDHRSARPVTWPQAFAAWAGLLRNRHLMLLTIGYAAVGYFQYLFFYWMEYYFAKVLHLEEARSRYLVAIPTVAMGIGMVLGGWLSDRLEGIYGARWGRRLVPIGAMTAGALLLGLGVWVREPAWIVMWFSLALCAVGAVEGPYWVTAVELGGRRGGSAAGILNTGGNGGGLLAPIITPWVGERLGWQAAVALGSLVSLLGAVLWFAIDPAKKPAKPGATQDDFKWT